MTRPPPRRLQANGPAEQGFALLIVLWTLVPLSLLMLVLAATASTRSRSAADLRTAAALEARADGAISTALFGLLGNGAGRVGSWQAEPGVVVTVSSLAGRVNPNTASFELLRALINRLGWDGASAQFVAAAMLDWRTPGQRTSRFGAKAPEYRAAGRAYGPPGAPFESLDELGLVLGMTPELQAALAPYLSPFAEPDPDPSAAAPVVRQALQEIGIVRVRSVPDTRVVEITARVQGPGDARAARRAIVRLGASPNGRPWRVLEWGPLPSH